MLCGLRHRPALHAVRFLQVSSPGRRHQHAAVGFNAVPRSSPSPKASPRPIKDSARNRPLEPLLTSDILRSLAVLSTASIPPVILRPLMTGFKNRSHTLLKIPAVSWVMRKTFYPQFCCGSSDHEIRKKMADLKRLGFSGTIMAYAKELPATSNTEKQTDDSRADVHFWLENNMKTVELTEPGNFVAIKYTGAGRSAAQTLRELSDSLPRENTPLSLEACFKAYGNVAKAISMISAAAKARRVRLLIDAETQETQRATDALTMSLMARFNTDGNAVVYNTYQMYLKSTPETLSAHLAASRARRFTLGIKMVRGAYLQSERDRCSLLHASKDDTDLAYDTAMAMLLCGGRPASATLLLSDDAADDRCRDIARHGDRVFAAALRRYPDVWQAAQQQQRPWSADVVFATHNKTSVQTALGIQKRLLAGGGGVERQGERVWPGKVNDVAYAQLLGMADELSMELCSRRRGEMGVQCYKYATWGTLDECVLYLLRRAEENRDALGRTKGTVGALVRELGWRVRKMVV